MAYTREEKKFGDRIKVRKVPCFTRAPGVTVFWVMLDGKEVNSFLTAARANAYAKKLEQSLAEKEDVLSGEESAQ